jgi:hypothetical protein
VPAGCYLRIRFTELTTKAVIPRASFASGRPLPRALGACSARLDVARERAGRAGVLVRPRASVRGWAAPRGRHRSARRGTCPRPRRRTRDVRRLRSHERADCHDRDVGRTRGHADASRLGRGGIRSNRRRGCRRRNGRSHRHRGGRRALRPPRNPSRGRPERVSRPALAAAGSGSRVRAGVGACSGGDDRAAARAGPRRPGVGRRRRIRVGRTASGRGSTGRRCSISGGVFRRHGSWTANAWRGTRVRVVHLGSGGCRSCASRRCHGDRRALRRLGCAFRRRPVRCSGSAGIERRCLACLEAAAFAGRRRRDGGAHDLGGAVTARRGSSRTDVRACSDAVVDLACRRAGSRDSAPAAAHELQPGFLGSRCSPAWAFGAPRTAPASHTSVGEASPAGPRPVGACRVSSARRHGAACRGPPQRAGGSAWEAESSARDLDALGRDAATSKGSPARRDAPAGPRARWSAGRDRRRRCRSYDL